MEMGEIKSVKVDNWGVFFLQKLQNFFNKTDYCDLTLQFRDNSQLKVHRLVLSACTDYFNVLEQTCDVVDDAIIMPNELQADVVVPIVNFMYTGTLEFELKMYNRLLRTAREMNMTVLLKLLEAHRRTMDLHPQKAQDTSSPKLRRRIVQTNSNANSSNNVQIKNTINTSSGSNVRLPTAPTTTTNVQRRVVPAQLASTRINQSTAANSGAMARQASGNNANAAVTYTRIKQENADANVSSAKSVTYSTKSSLQQQKSASTPTSTFEQLRKSYNNNKRPPTATFISPPAKKPNLEDVKEFAEQQRMRKQIAAEYGDADGDYDGALMDDDVHNDDDDDDMSGNQTGIQTYTTTSNTQTSSSNNQTSTATITTNDKSSVVDPPGTTTITVKHEGPDKPPTIVVKDSSNSKMNHAKIISEVLRQYPHLIKSNKNIKLKIMPSSSNTGTNSSNSSKQKIIVKKEISGVTEKIDSQQQITKMQHNVSDKVNTKPDSMTTSLAPVGTTKTATIATSTSAGTNTTSSGQKQQQRQKSASSTGHVQQQVKMQENTITSVKRPASVPSKTSSTTSTLTTTNSQQTQKKRIDSKTMHALIALGAENTTGPWLCLRCGRNGHPISIPSYRGFRRHLINTHKETIDPDLCEYCGWRSSTKRELHFHMQLEHKVKTNLYIFPECQICDQMCIDSDALNQHLIDSHPDENKQQCIYCNKIFPEEMQLYTHMKTYHKKQALEDGIIDYSDDEITNQQEQNFYQELMEEFTSTNDSGRESVGATDSVRSIQAEDEKIKILSNISLPSTSSIMKQEDTIIKTKPMKGKENEYKTVTSPVTTYLHDAETKFITPDGNEVILTDEQRKEILSQLSQENDGSGVMMVLTEQQTDQLDALNQDETSQTTTETMTNEQPEHDDSHIYDEMKSQIELSTVNTAHSSNKISNSHENEEDDNDDNNESDEETDEQRRNVKMNESDSDHHYQRKGNNSLNESKESLDNLEWAEKLINQHELADTSTKSVVIKSADPMDVDDKNTSDAKNLEESDEIEDNGDGSGSERNRSLLSEEKCKDVQTVVPCTDEISKKLKELTGDWSDDDIDENMADEELAKLLKEKNKTVESPVIVITTAGPVATSTTKIITAVGSMLKSGAQKRENDELISKIKGRMVGKNDVKSKRIVKANEEEVHLGKDIKTNIRNINKCNDTDNSGIDDDEDDVEDDIDLALKTLHKDTEPELESSSDKDHNVSDELERLNAKLRNEITSRDYEQEDNSRDNVDNDACNVNVDTDNNTSEKEITEESKRTASSSKDLEKTTKNDLIEMLINDAKVRSNKIDGTSVVIKDNAGETATTKATTSTALNRSSSDDENPNVKEENDLNVNDGTDSENLDDKEEFVPEVSHLSLINENNDDVGEKQDIKNVADSSNDNEINVIPHSTSTEDRVKSLMSEWGDDDDDEDDDDDDDGENDDYDDDANSESVLTKNL